MAESALGVIHGQKQMSVVEGTWRLDEDDWLLYAMLCDPVCCAELLFDDPLNHTNGGCYTVYDYQYPLFRPDGCYQAFPCARSVGKTESIKARSVSHAFKRMGEDMLLTAPELIHLEALTQHVEYRLSSVRLTREFLKRDSQKTGFTHKPFMVDFADGTRIIGRIPKLSGPQPLDARILTPGGWTTMGAIEPGQEVFAGDGCPTEVVGVTNNWRSPIFRVEFSDGTYTHADASHRWNVRTDSKDWHTRNTREIMDALGGPPKRNGGSLNMYRVPVQPGVEFGYCEPLIMDPYLLGVLLGDGSMSQKSVVLTTADAEVRDEVTERLYAGHALRPIGHRGLHYQVIGDGRRNEVCRALRELELLGHTAHTKFVPQRYKQAPFDCRLELLRGLLDTDGSAKHGGAHLVSASRQLVEDAAEICRSLGGWASVGRESRHSGGVYWRVTLRLFGFNLFLLRRKAERYRVEGRQRHRSITAVVPAGEADVRCIKVRADSESYLTDFAIPTLNTGVKGMHEPDLIIDEAQDYPPKGWTECHETVLKDHVDSTGNPDFTYHLYGVHSGAAGGRFEAMAQSGEFKVTAITALMRPGWNKQEKAAAAAMYGGTHSPDYRRNILGEPGTALSQFFVTARLMACLDQDSESKYNTIEFKDIHITAEDADKTVGPGGDISPILDLPTDLGPLVYAGMDVGLINDPTVISLFCVAKDKDRKERLKLVRLIHLWRFREKQIRQVAYKIDLTYGRTLQAFGTDITGMGLPLLQAMEDDEVCPEHLRQIVRGYVFNALVPVAVDKDYVSSVGGKMVDQYGNAVKIERDKWTGQDRYVSQMTMIEASTRYLRNMVDTTYLLLPFHQGLVKDMQGETEQRVRAMGSPHLRKKPSAFHMLDSLRAMAMAFRSREVEEHVMQHDAQAVLDVAVDLTPGVGGGMGLEPIPA